MVALLFNYVECYPALCFWDFCTWVFDLFFRIFKFLEVIIMAKKRCKVFTGQSLDPYEDLIPFHDSKAGVRLYLWSATIYYCGRLNLKTTQIWNCSYLWPLLFRHYYVDCIQKLYPIVSVGKVIGVVVLLVFLCVCVSNRDL